VAEFWPCFDRILPTGTEENFLKKLLYLTVLTNTLKQRQNFISFRTDPLANAACFCEIGRTFPKLAELFRGLVPTKGLSGIRGRLGAKWVALKFKFFFHPQVILGKKNVDNVNFLFKFLLHEISQWLFCRNAGGRGRPVQRESSFLI
jgi:hypothetical protein